MEYLRLLRTQWYSKSRLEDLQAEKLTRLMQEAFPRMPGYAGYNRAQNIRGESLRECLAAWPILTKDRIRAHPRGFRHYGGPAWLVHKATTGGTTGDPIKVWKCRRSQAVSTAAFWRGMQWLRIEPWDKGLITYGFARGSWYGRLRMRMTRKWGLEAFATSEAGSRAFSKLLKKIKPVCVEGFITDLLRLGELTDCTRYGIRNVITTSEMLYEGQKETLEKLYGARVADYYGSNEINSIAFECEEGMKHVTDEHVVLETVDDAGRPVWDSPGRILVTDLDNHVMPLVRYELGDTGVLTSEPCNCGRRLTVLKSLLGRTQDALQNDAGEKLSAVFFAGKFKDIKKIRRFQLVQKTIRDVDLIYEVAEPGMERELAAIVAEIRNRLGQQMIVREQRVENLPRTKVGKCRLVVGLPDQQNAEPMA